jgi:hypothetical protein
MNRLYILGLICFLSFHFLQAQELKTPAPSPLGTVTQIFGLTEISVSYSRPGVKGREIFGGLLPYGELWRTGANKSTTIKVSDDVMIEGKKLPAGEYALFTIPEKKEWTVILSKSIGPGTSKYDQKEDVLRFKVIPQSLSQPVERLTIEIADMTDNSARFVLKWASTEISFAMTVDTDKNVMGQIDALMKNPALKDPDMFYSAADYYFNTGRDFKQALSWVSRAVELKPDGFWISRLKSRIEAKMGDYKAAIKSAELSMKAAEKADNQQYVRFNREAIAEWQTKL